MKPRPGIRINFVIPIPKAVAELIDSVKYSFRKTAFKMRPYRCAVCNAKMNIRNPQYEHVFANNQRLIVENHTQPPICRSCMIDELETKEWTPRFTQMRKSKGQTTRREYQFWSAKKCAITGKTVRSFKDVEIYPHIDMLFCTIAWNHDYISKEAVIECIKHGRIRTSRWGVWNKQRMAPMNDKGLFIDERGELL